MLHCEPMSTLYTFQVLERLADGSFHSGEALAKHFGISRTTVWEAIQDAQAMGIEIFSVRGKGYRLPSKIIWLSLPQIQQSLGEMAKQMHVSIHDRLPSTNTYLMQQAAKGEPHLSCVVARMQTAGKGRRGRTWQASLGSSLTFSLLWRFDVGASGLNGLSLAVGVGLIRALHAVGARAATLKWPNDLLIDAKKLGGILIELQGDMDGPSAAVVGVGLNLDLQIALKAKIDQPFTDLASQTQNEVAVNPNKMLATLLLHLNQVLMTFSQHGFESLREEWLRYHYYQDKLVSMLMPDGATVSGIASGIDVDGALRVTTKTGERRFVSGEISLRGSGA